MRDQDTPKATPTTLDRVWEATRPAELTSDAFDRIWTEVVRAHDAPAAIAFDSKTGRRGRRAFGLIAVAMAQAAAVAGVAFVLNRTDGREGKPATVARVDPTPSRPVGDLEIDVDETVVIELAGDRVGYSRTRLDGGTTLALRDLPAINPNDQLNQWESLAND